MSNIQGKVWGKTEEIYKNSTLEFHRIDFNAGYQCSEHKHQTKSNGFYVVSGEMLVRVWQKEQGLIDETLLGPGDFTAVKPGLYHQFIGIEDGLAFELYWSEMEHNDIQRQVSGGESPADPT